MNQPKVTVIIPVYNTEKYLRECLDSVVNQTLKAIEIICVDDGSTDGSLAILRDYEVKDERFHVLTQNNLNAGVARNRGMEQAKGQYYMFLDADDFFEADMLEKMFAQASTYDADICLCGADKYDINVRNYESMPWCLNLGEVKKQPFCSANTSNILTVTTPVPWTKLISAEFIRHHNLRFQDTPHTNDMYFIYCAIALATKIVYVDQIFAHYRVGQNSNLQSGLYKTPTVCCDVWLAIKQRLEGESCWRDVEDSFLTTAHKNLVFNIKMLKAYPEAKSVLIKEISSSAFQALGLRGCPFEIMVDQESYREECADANGIRVCEVCVRTWMKQLPDDEREDAFKRFWQYRRAFSRCSSFAAHMTSEQASALYEPFGNIKLASETEIELFRQLIVYGDVLVRAQNELSETRDVSASASYRIGRAVTWLPRKVRGGVRCFQDHGAGYTVRRALYHVGLWRDEEKD